MAEPFKLCILVGDSEERNPAELSPGWDIAEVPVALQLKPFESNANWAAKRAEIESWNLPPIKVASHFLQFFGLKAAGPGVDWEQLDFWTKRAFERLADLGIEVAGVYGGFFTIPEGFSRTKAMDQGMRFANMMADYAEPHGIYIALEPLGTLNTLWPTYLEALAFAKEVGRPEVRLMADIDYFPRLNRPLDDIAEAPEYCMHCHIAGKGGQPGVGDCDEEHTHLFRILRDIGYERGVSCACGWVSTKGGELDYGAETAKTLKHLQDLRDKVYSD